jgi:Fic family protein
MENVQKALLLKQEIDMMRPLDKNQEARIMQKFRLDWNYHSNNLEGNSLTFGETKALILHGITAQGKPLKDHFEITGHDEAIKWVEDVLKNETPLTEHFIRQLHTLLLKESSEKDAITPDGKPTKRVISVGKYKTTPNHVKTKTGEIFYFASPEETPAKMHDLMNWYNEQKKKADVNPILLAAEFHYKFIRIHPFDDGNGRTARILMNFILMQYHFPPVIIKTEDKENYYSVLRQADADILEPFIEYIASNLVRSLEIMIKGAKGESIDDENDIDKELFLLEQKLNSIGKRIERFKSKDAIIWVFENSIAPLVNTLIQASERFQKFYRGDFLFIEFDKEARYVHDFTNQKIELITNISDKTDKITVTNKFLIFNRENVNEFNYDSTVVFLFEQKKYSISTEDQRIVLSKYYDEILTESELKQIIDYISKRHIITIQKFIDNRNEEAKENE